jgi:hypothetical protein
MELDPRHFFDNQEERQNLEHDIDIEEEEYPEPFKTQEKLQKAYDESLFLHQKYHIARGGNKMLIEEMSDDHLKNMIKLIMSKIECSKNEIEIGLLKRKVAVYALEYTKRALTPKEATPPKKELAWKGDPFPYEQHYTYDEDWK